MGTYIWSDAIVPAVKKGKKIKDLVIGYWEIYKIESHKYANPITSEKV